MPVWLNCNEKEKKPNILNDKETFLSAKSWIFTSVILWGADNKIEKRQH
jgi:hypothetical protein